MEAKVINSTYLKQSTAQSFTLQPNEVVLLKKGGSVQFNKVEQHKDSNYYVLELPVPINNKIHWLAFKYDFDWEDIKPEQNKNKQLILSSTFVSIFDKQPEDKLLDDLNSCLNTFNITTSNRIRHFLSQAAHESGGLEYFEEFGTGEDYEYREDLGNTEEGDGVTYKGAGVLQVTGRHNYEGFSNYINDRRVMEGYTYVTKKYPFSISGFWWLDNDMNTLCDTNPSVEEVTLRVNGGYNGLEDRLSWYAKVSKYI